MLVKNNKSLINTKNPSLKYLINLNRQLDSMQKQSKTVNKEIKNEVQHAKKTDLNIEKSLDKINLEGQALVHRYQQQKQKNQQLQYLVKDIQEKLYKIKLDRLQEIKTKGETDKLCEVSSILQNKEKQLEKIIQKTNTSSYQISKKMDTIRAQRSQRTIVSSLMNKVQRQICNLEQCYKMLVIEKYIQQHEYQAQLEQFKVRQTTAWKEINKTKQKKQRNQTQNSQIRQTNRVLTQEPQIQFRRESITCLPTGPTQPTEQQRVPVIKEFDQKIKTKKKIYQQQMTKLQNQRVVKEIFNDLGINSIKEFPFDLNQLNKQNQLLYKKVDQIQEQIFKVQHSISQLFKKKTKNVKKSKQVNNAIFNKNKILEVSLKIDQDRMELNQFNRILKILYENQSQTAKGTSNDCLQQFFNEHQQTKFYLAYLQASLKAIQRIPTQNQKDKKQNKINNQRRLSDLFSIPAIDKNNMNIYDEAQLMIFAKKNIEAAKKTNIMTQ